MPIFDTRLTPELIDRYSHSGHWGTETFYQILARRAEARGWYERAAALYPGAQSPLLGLSRLAQLEGDRAGAISVLDQALHLPASDGDGDDPWWTYHTTQGRNAAERLNALYRAIPPAEVH